MDRTTLSRNLKPLVASGLVEASDGWGRSRAVGVTPKGRQLMAEALPLWKAAQDEVHRRFGKTRWHAVSGELSDLVAAI
jgi:DNA-binding MarR family transcriptional regulator